VDRVIELAHGAGAKETWDLIKELIVDKVPQNLRSFRGVGIDVLDDGAVIDLGSVKLVTTVDSYTVNPIFFPGGHIGTLAVSGTINDLVMMGARPVAIMDSLVVEEGLEVEVIERIVSDMLAMLSKYGISLIGGDFKVMPRNSIDKMIITMVGIGIANRPVIDSLGLREGDKIIVTGPIAEHGTAILAAQLGMIDKVRGIASDVRPLLELLTLFDNLGEHIHAARDPTRGGLAATLNEWARSTGLMVIIDRSKIPIRREVKEFLDAMGIDPLTVASEGIAVLAVSSEFSDQAIDMLRSLGFREASIIGEVRKPPSPLLEGKVVAITEVGGKTIVEPKALNLPRIC